VQLLGNHLQIHTQIHTKPHPMSKCLNIDLHTCILA